MAKFNRSLTSITPHAPGEQNFVDTHRDNTDDVNADKLANNGNDGMSGKSASAKVKIFPRKKFHFGNDMKASIDGYDDRSSKLHSTSISNNKNDTTDDTNEGVVFSNHLRRGRKKTNSKGNSAALNLVRKLSGANKGGGVKSEAEQLSEMTKKGDLKAIEKFYIDRMKEKMDRQMHGLDDPKDPDRTGEISFHHAMRAWAAQQRVASPAHIPGDDGRGYGKRIGAFSKEMVKRGEAKNESLVEHIPANASIKTYIDDFQSSTNPRFAGKSKEERRKMAIGAWYGRNESLHIEDNVVQIKSHPKYNVRPGTHFSLNGKNAHNERVRKQADRLGYIKHGEYPRGVSSESEGLSFLKAIVENKAVAPGMTQTNGQWGSGTNQTLRDRYAPKPQRETLANKVSKVKAIVLGTK